MLFILNTGLNCGHNDNSYPYHGACTICYASSPWAMGRDGMSRVFPLTMPRCLGVCDPFKVSRSGFTGSRLKTTMSKSHDQIVPQSSLLLLGGAFFCTLGSRVLSEYMVLVQ